MHQASRRIFVLICSLSLPLAVSFVYASHDAFVSGHKTEKMSSAEQHHHHMIDTEEREGLEEPIWDPVAQIYVGGKLPENAQVAQMIRDNHGALRLFGYGSLCWNPGTGPLAHLTVSSTLGRARGYRRCWAQRSTDHRGNPSFPGIVCTLLTDDEFDAFRERDQTQETLTEGLIYNVPPELVDECLAELDFREKGGYARDIINVVEDDSGETVQALLYRGTPDNPAFWPRALRDLPFAAAVIAAAKGPSGKNEVYLNRLDEFLEEATNHSPTELKKFDDTFALASMEAALRPYQLHFLFGCGSNQHNQLLLKSDNNAAALMNGEDAHELKDMVLGTKHADDFITDVYAGGGHSGLVTKSGRLYLFGWNESGQLGSSGMVKDDSSPLPVPLLTELDSIRVEKAALGFGHTLVIEKETARLLCFGDNLRGQVDGTTTSDKVVVPKTPSFLLDDRVVDIATGLFHSAAVTQDGDLVTFGCGHYGQSLSSLWKDTVCIGGWRPDDDCQVLRVACGRRHTVVLDAQGRMWSFGDNKYGQLGRELAVGSRDATPGLVTGDWDSDGFTIDDIRCGWSHTVVVTKDQEGSTVVFGWGRNDKGQLGTGSQEKVMAPIRLFDGHEIESVTCGSESTMVVDNSGDIWGCGWNEHGNLATGNDQDTYTLSKVTGAVITMTPGYSQDDSRIAIAAGGSHALAMKVMQS